MPDDLTHLKNAVAALDDRLSRIEAGATRHGAPKGLDMEKARNWGVALEHALPMKKRVNLLQRIFKIYSPQDRSIARIEARLDALEDKVFIRR